MSNPEAPAAEVDAPAAESPAPRGSQRGTRPAASLDVHEVTFRYGSAGAPVALDTVSFRVEPGERVGLLGPNGAGKSTLMRLICGYLRLPAGRGAVQVSGHSVATESSVVRTMVGYLPELVPLYPELRVDEHLRFRAAIKRVPRRERAGEASRVASLTGLADMLSTPIGRLSRGYRQRVGIADALIGAPPLVVLDEPTVGLDPNQVKGIRTMLKNLGGTQTLLFSSHLLAEVEALCDRIIILSRGKKVADERVSDAMAGALVVELACSMTEGKAILAAARSRSGLDGVDRVEPKGEGVRALCAGETTDWTERRWTLAEAIGAEALSAGVAVRRLEAARRQLEERFAAVTGAGEQEDG
jgi:ABC-2 type transport system ATP-binding protein